MHSNGVCVLSAREACALEFHGILPSCHNHRHLSRGRADDLIEENLVYRDDRGDYVRVSEVRWLGKGKKYLAFVRGRAWKRMDSDGTTVMQLVPAGGLW